MSRYIDADKAKEKLGVVRSGYSCFLEEDRPYYDVLSETIKMINEMPTANVVEVIRCKDCKYRHKEWYQDKRNKDGGYWLVCCENDAIAERIYGLAQDNDFCSYGERKEE